eukprot:s1174_g3.t1
MSPGPGPSVVIGSAVSAEHEDRIERPPADGGARPEAGAVSDSVRSSRSADSRVDGPPPCIRMLIHGVAIAIVVAAVVCAVIGFVLMVVQSVLNLQDCRWSLPRAADSSSSSSSSMYLLENWPVYKKGAENVAQAVQKAVAHATGSMPKSVAEEPWPAEIAGPKFASFLESTLDQLLCKHRELLVTQFREVLKDDKLGPTAPTSRPPALKPALDPGLAERLKGSESFLAKAHREAVALNSRQELATQWEQLPGSFETPVRPTMPAASAEIGLVTLLALGLAVSRFEFWAPPF